MLDAVLGGEADATVFADRARGQPRATLPALQQALVGRVKPHHLIVIGQILSGSLVKVRRNRHVKTTKIHRLSA